MVDWTATPKLVSVVTNGQTPEPPFASVPQYTVPFVVALRSHDAALRLETMSALDDAAPRSVDVPVLSMEKMDALVLPAAFVDDAMEKSVVLVFPYDLKTERVDPGVDVPMPTFPVASNRNRSTPSVEKPMIFESLPGVNMPVFGSFEKTYVGADADPLAFASSAKPWFGVLLPVMYVVPIRITSFPATATLSA